VSQPQASEVNPPANLPLVLGAVATALLLASLGQTIVTTALPVIVGDLGGLDQLSWAITSYLLAATVVTPIYGKLGDMFGRKIVLQVGIVIFLVGSGLAAISNSMTMLVAARVIQGLGAGGLIVVPMAAVGDLVPPRQRGAIQGWLGGVFGFSTVVGPLIGGFLVEQLSWHWLFLVNLPIGILSFIVITFALHTPQKKVSRAVDYAGAATLALLLSAIVLYTSLGGTVIEWFSIPGIGLLVLAVLGLVGFIVAEGRAQEPILPLSLFRNNAFLVSNIVGFLIGMAMFGSITFLPLFLQMVMHVSPTEAGLRLIPMMGGLIGSSALAGWIMSRWGRYKLLPILSSLILGVAMLLLGTITPHTNIWVISFYMFLAGVGIGPVMSVGVTAIQNAVPRAVLGVGTASANMFRQIGGSIGVSVFGAIFANRLAAELAAHLPAGGSMPAQITVNTVAALPPEIQEPILFAYAYALHPVFWVAAAAAGIAFVTGLMLKEIPLADSFDRSARAQPDEARPVAAE